MLSDFTNLFGIRLSLRICLTFPRNFIYFKLGFHLFLAVLDLCCFARFSLVAVSTSYSLVVIHGLLIAVASLVGGRALERVGSVVQHVGSVVVALWL